MTPRYRRARELAGLTLAQAERLTGIGRVTLQNFENHVLVPESDVTATLARVYGCSLDWLQGADPVVPEDTRKMLRDADINPTERDDLLELIGSIGTRK